MRCLIFSTLKGLEIFYLILALVFGEIADVCLAISINKVRILDKLTFGIIAEVLVYIVLFLHVYGNGRLLQFDYVCQFIKSVDLPVLSLHTCY